MARPGIMIYFDFLEPIEVLPDSDKGKLLVAMLQYGKTGKEPNFDGMLALAWGFVRVKLDRDGQAYENAKIQRKYAAFCNQCKKLNIPKVPFESWLNMDDAERHRMLSIDNEPLRAVNLDDSRYPTITRTVTGTISGTGTVAVTGSETDDEDDDEDTDTAAADTDRQLKVIHGDLGQGVLLLTDGQMQSLLDKMGLDVFEHYAKKLSSFIVKNSASVMDHYATMLKWWKEDSRSGRHEK